MAIIMSLFYFNWKSFFGNVGGIPEFHHRCFLCGSTKKVKFTTKLFYEGLRISNEYICKKCRQKYQ